MLQTVCLGADRLCCFGPRLLLPAPELLDATEYRKFGMGHLHVTRDTCETGDAPAEHLVVSYRVEAQLVGLNLIWLNKSRNNGSTDGTTESPRQERTLRHIRNDSGISGMLTRSGFDEYVVTP